MPPRSTYKEETHGKDVAAQATPANVRLYPHCKNCMRRQGGKMSGMTKADKLTAGQKGFKANKPP